MTALFNDLHTFIVPALARRLWRPKGFERLIRWLVPPTAFAEADIREVVAEDFRMKVFPHSHVGWQLYCLGTYERGVRNLIRRHVKPGDTCLDIGANIGWHSLLLAKLVGPSGHVHCFEPNPSVLRLLYENLRLNNVTNASIHPMAVGNVVGHVAFNAPSVGSREAGDGYVVARGKTESKDVVQVPLCTLDSLFPDGPPVRFVKIDVEGYETAALDGGVRILERDQPIVCMEQLPIHLQRAGFTPGDPTRELRRIGYRFFSISGRRTAKPISDVVEYSGDFCALPPRTLRPER